MCGQDQKINTTPKRPPCYTEDNQEKGGYMEISEEQIQLILKALENPKFKWRTIDGISSEAGLSPEQVREAISAMSDKIVKSSIPSEDGRALFTSRKQFREKASAFEKIMGAIKNRAE
jgi:hypothetical protein